MESRACPPTGGQALLSRRSLKTTPKTGVQNNKLVRKRRINLIEQSVNLQKFTIAQFVLNTYTFLAMFGIST